MVLPRPALSPVPVDDATLVAQARAGDERAFTTLYHRHARYIAGVAFRLMGADHELDDVVQETFTDAALALGSLREPAGLRAWLVSIAVRRVHRRLARRRRWRWVMGQIERVAVHTSDPHDRREVDALYEALDGLSPRLRLPWVLHVVEGQTLPEAAAACDVSLATVKRRVAEADALIQRRLHHAR